MRIPMQSEKTCVFYPPEPSPPARARGRKATDDIKPALIVRAIEVSRVIVSQTSFDEIFDLTADVLFHFIIYIYKVPLGDVLRKIPGVGQVEKGDAGNTAVATAYFCWVQHSERNSRTRVPADYFY